MKFEGGREQRTSGGGEHAKRQVYRSKTPSSEKSKTQLLRSWTIVQKYMFSLKLCKTPTSEKQKKILKMFWNDRFRGKTFGPNDSNFRHAADCLKFASLERAAAAMSQLSMR